MAGKYDRSGAERSIVQLSGAAPPNGGIGHLRIHHFTYPLAIAPMRKYGSAPEAGASGSGTSGGSFERSR
jgi:hypothetical protein